MKKRQWLILSFVWLSYENIEYWISRMAMKWIAKFSFTNYSSSRSYLIIILSRFQLSLLLPFRFHCAELLVCDAVLEDSRDGPQVPLELLQFRLRNRLSWLFQAFEYGLTCVDETLGEIVRRAVVALLRRLCLLLWCLLGAHLRSGGCRGCWYGLIEGDGERFYDHCIVAKLLHHQLLLIGSGHFRL